MDTWFDHHTMHMEKFLTTMGPTSGYVINFRFKVHCCLISPYSLDWFKKLIHFFSISYVEANDLISVTLHVTPPPTRPQSRKKRLTSERFGIEKSEQLCFVPQCVIVVFSSIAKILVLKSSTRLVNFWLNVCYNSLFIT